MIGYLFILLPPALLGALAKPLAWAREASEELVAKALASERGETTPSDVSSGLNDGAARAMLPTLADRDVRRVVPCPIGNPGTIGATALSVVVVEDSRLTREGIVTILGQHPDIEIVGVAVDADDALLRVSETHVDVVLVDAGLDEHDPYDLVQIIREASPESRVVVMDIVSDAEDIMQFVRRGASGFVVKDADIETFVTTIRSVAGGARVLPDALTGTFFSHIASETRARKAPEGAGRVTPREREIIDLIAEGASNKRISRELGISVHTVKSHMRSILEKLSLHSRLEVAAHVHRTRGGLAKEVARDVTQWPPRHASGGGRNFPTVDGESLPTAPDELVHLVW